MTELTITPWKCPFCVGGLVTTDGDRCLRCAGTGLTDKPLGDADVAPRPPAVMRSACADCAFRRGSPELENAGTQLPDQEPFFCHQGVPVSASGAYQPTAMFRGLPLGLMVCAGWWAVQTGELQVGPGREYREVLVDPSTKWGLPRALAGGPLTDEQRAALRANYLTSSQTSATPVVPVCDDFLTPLSARYGSDPLTCTKPPGHAPADPWHQHGPTEWRSTYTTEIRNA